jgi:putative hydrolase of the HAD superfamily
VTEPDTIGFDADDTLWQNEQFFRFTEKRFVELLAGYADHLSRRLLASHARNIAIYGFGIKGFMLSMVETALDVTNNSLPAGVIAEILAAGRDMLSHPIEPLPHVRETLDALAGSYRLVLITKGDLFDQERKVAQSGLGEFFDAIEIVSDKTRQTYERIFERHGSGAAASVMVGNSLGSDIVPAIEAGGWGVYIPHDLTWSFEHVEPPALSPRFRQIGHMGELPAVLAEIG